MYYNKIIKITNWVLSSSILAIIIIGLISNNSEIALRIGLVGLSLQQFLLGYNCYKMKKENYQVGISVVAGIIISIVTIKYIFK